MTENVGNIENRNGMLLKIRNLTKRFSEGAGVEGINLDINKGEVIALIGSSGSGKSTLMNLITRTIKKDTGEILVEDKEIALFDNKLFAKKVGMLRQQFDLVENIKVVHNVLSGRFNEWGFLKSFISLIKPQEINYAEEALRKIGLEDKIFEATSSLSGGQKQRVAIARLLVQNPELILADEPVSSLDPVNTRRVLSLITNLAKNEGKALMASMHSVEYSKEFFDRIVGLKKGRIIFDEKSKYVNENMIRDLYEVKIDGEI